jgi:hypothetical protein
MKKSVLFLCCYALFSAGCEKAPSTLPTELRTEVNMTVEVAIIYTLTKWANCSNTGSIEFYFTNDGGIPSRGAP